MKKWTVVILVGALLYIPLFPVGLRKEQTLRPIWAVRVVDSAEEEYLVSSRRPEREDGEELFPFETRSMFGYVDSAGNVRYLDRKLDGVTIDPAGFVNYSRVGTDLVVQLPDGTVEASLPARGYPVFLEGRLLVLATNRMRVSEWTTDGRPVWDRGFGALISAFDVRGDHAIVGLLDGRVYVLDRAGRSLFDGRMTGGRVDAIYGCTVAGDGSQFVVVHGLDPQRMSVFEEREGVYGESAVFRLEDEFRRHRLIYLTEDGASAFVEAHEGVLGFDLDRGTSRGYETATRLSDFGALRAPGFVWFTGEGESVSTLTVLTESGLPMFFGTMATQRIVGTAGASELYLSAANRVGRIDVQMR